MLVLDPGGRAPFGPAKWALLAPAVLTAAALGFLGPRTPDLWLGRLWVGLLAWVGVCAALGLDRVGAWIGTPERRMGGLAWVLAAAAFAAGRRLDEDGRRVVRRTATIVGGALGLWVVAEVFGWEPLALSGAGSRPVGPLGSSAYVGAAGVLCGAVAGGEASDGSAAWRRVAAMCCAFAIVAVVASGARAAWVGAIAAVVVTAIARRWRPRWQHGLLAGALLAVAFAFGVAGRAASVATDDHGGARGRLDEWRVAVRLIGEHPMTGVGPEGYRIAFGAAVDDSYEKEHGRDPLPDRAHSAPLDVAATLGLPGLALVLLVLAAIVSGWRRAIGATGPEAGVAAALAGYGVQAMFLFPLAELDPIAWLLAGTCLATATARGGTRRRGAAAVAVLGLGAALVLGAVGIAGVIADRRSRAGDHAAAVRLRPDIASYHLASAAAHEEVGSSAGLDRAIAAVEDARRVSPRDPAVVAERTRLLLSRARRTSTPRHVDEARDALESAAIADPRNAALLLRLGLVRSLDGDDAGAVEAWRDAERLAPRSAAASVDLALLHARAGRVTEAEAAARRALERDPGNAVAERILRDLDGT